MILGVLACLAGCKAEHEVAHAPTAPQAAQQVASVRAGSAPIAGPRVAPGASFDLTATSEGAVLLWAAGQCDLGLALQRFDPDGAPIGERHTLDACTAGEPPSALVAELTAAAGGGRIGVTWLVHAGERASVLATYGPDTATAWAPVLQLGAADVSAVSTGASTTEPQRGLVWLAAASTGQLRAAWRAPPTPCTGQPGTCAQLVQQQLPPAAGSSGRPTDTRELPHPCARLLVGSISQRGVWYDAFCALDSAAGAPMTTAYTIKPEIYYAEAATVLQQCSPRGIAPAERGAAIFGDCADGTGAVQLIGDNPRTLRGRIARTLQCESGRPIVALHDEHGHVESYKLTGPRDRLELWLPDSLAERGSRAVFTGRRLLIASQQDQRLRLQRYRCEGESVVSEADAML
ncbi:MAG: hypothetical protein ABW321_14480 [Polyangiales bacterium]